MDYYLNRQFVQKNNSFWKIFYLGHIVSLLYSNSLMGSGNIHLNKVLYKEMRLVYITKLRMYK